MQHYRKALITLSLVVLLTAANTGKARADGFNPGSKANTHTQSKPEQSCHNWTANGWIVKLDYYLDGDTPTDIAYSDYLSDLNHYYSQYSGTCKSGPERLP
jgi:hypothetical protein